MRALERQGRLDRAVEFLPDTAAMRARAANRQYLTRPELCGAAGLRQDRPQRRDPGLRPARRSAAGRRAAALLPDRRCSRSSSRDPRHHRLRREIATLQVVNSLVNRCGPTFVRTVGAAHRRARPRRSPAPSPWCATPGSCATCGSRSRRSTRAQGRGADPHAGRLAALPDCAPCNGPCAACRSRSTRMAATEQLGAAVAALGDLPSSLIGEAESAALNERAAAFEALGAPPDTARRAAALETLAGGRRPDAGGQAPTAAASRRRPGSISGWASGCRSPAWRRRRTSCRATASGRRRRRSPCTTSWRRCTPIS